MATVISHRMATLRELQTFYGAEDLYGMLEIIAVDTHNQNVMQSQKEP